MLETLFERALDAIVVFDDRGRYSDANPAACRLFGLTREELLERPMTEFAASQADVEAFWERLRRAGQDRGEGAIKTADGRLRYVEYQAKAHVVPGRHLAVFRDVTERRQADRDLRANAEFLQRLIESSQDCVKVLDLDGALRFMNEAGRRLLEITNLEPYLGRLWLDLWVDEGRTRAEIALERGRAGEANTFEGFGVTPAGTAKWWETSVAPIRGADGRPERLLVVSREITDRVRAAQDKAFLAQATETLTRSLGYRDTLNNVVHVAVPFLAELCALDVVEGGAVRRVLWSDGRPEWRPAVDAIARHEPLVAMVQAARPALISPVTEASTAASMLGPVETVRALRLRSAITIPLTSPENVTLGVITLAVASADRRYEDRHLALAEELALRAALAIQNARLYAAAEAARATAEAAGRAKDEFLATLAHELRNPLGAIVNAIASLNRIGAMTDDARQARAVIGRQTDHLAAILDDLLDVARIGQGKVELQLEAVDLCGIVHGVLEADRHRLEAKQQRLSVSIAPEPVVVRGDAVRLRQIVANLVNNASKYTPAGGRVAVSVRVEGGEAVFRVRDTGRGIPSSRLETIFEMFAQVENTSGRGEGGLGIGLTLVRRLAALHGGAVAASSDGEGKGSEFVVRLPRFAGEIAKKDLPPVTVLAHSRILLIEDNVDAREVLAMALALDGHQVLVAGSAADGVEMAMTERPEVIIVDIGLPDADGYEVARRLRDSFGSDVVLVAFSGYGQPEDRRRSEKAGFDMHIVKPVSPDTLLGELSRYLRRR